MVNFDNEEQKAFVLDCMSKCHVATTDAEKVAEIVRAIRNATVAGKEHRVTVTTNGVSPDGKKQNRPR